MFLRNKYIILGMLLAIGVTTIGGQNRVHRPYDNHLDTLTFAERINLRTNVVNWVTLMPNIGLEFALGNKNWHKWTIGANFKFYAMNTNATSRLLRITDGKLEVRRYWHGRGNRRSYFLGAYAGNSYFDLKVSDTGKRGHALYGGLTGGTIAPLYTYQGRRMLDLELSANAGVMLARMDKYRFADGRQREVLERVSDYRLSWDPLIYVAANDVIRVSVVWHIGASVVSKYKKRIAIDERYRLHMSDVEMKRDSTRQANSVRDSIRRDSLDWRDYERRFEKQRREREEKFIRDSIANARKKETAK